MFVVVFFFPWISELHFFAEYFFPTAPKDVNVLFYSPVPHMNCYLSERLKTKQNNKQSNNNNSYKYNTNNKITTKHLPLFNEI